MSTARAAPSPGFASLGLSDSLLAAVTALGYEEPTAVQRESIPALLSGRDLLAQAATGTGKTAAFALPILQRLGGDTHGKHRTRALVLVPTRELCMQVAEAVHKYGQGSGLAVVPIYGGASLELQARALKRGADVVVATPGRTLDHLRRKTLALDGVVLLILDEADEMLDMGFAEDLDAILKATPSERQTALFSATMPPDIERIARRHLREPERVAIAHEATAAGKLPRVRQVAYVVRRDQKLDVLGRVLDVEEPASALVFCRTRVEVDSLVETLNARGYRALALHGGLQQRQRDAVMTRFRSGKSDLLIATDVAARGLDIRHLSHVINFDLPSSSEVYVHRIGRTGRAGGTGTAITFVEPRERRLLHVIEQVTQQAVEVAAIPSVADLRARRLQQMSAALRERLLAGGLDEARAVVEALAAEFPTADVAAAAVQLLHAAASAGKEERELEAPPVPAARREGGDRGTGERPYGKARLPRPVIERPVRLFIGLGRAGHVRPADIVGAIAGESGISSRELGAIEIGERFSLITVPEAWADRIIEAMKGGKLLGRKVAVRRFQEK
jgi:ATP-dependent RNA helicase DeaD